MKKILFVCLGNICRSPLAHAIFQDIVNKNKETNNFFVESAGTGSWHVGENADPRMRQTAQKHQVTINHKARQFHYTDFDEYDFIIAMDSSNYKNICSQAKNKEQIKKVFLMRDFDQQNNEEKDVPDPYYGGSDGFENVYQIVQRSCQNLYKKLSTNEL